MTNNNFHTALIRLMVFAFCVLNALVAFSTQNVYLFSVVRYKTITFLIPTVADSGQLSIVTTMVKQWADITKTNEHIYVKFFHPKQYPGVDRAYLAYYDKNTPNEYRSHFRDIQPNDFPAMVLCVPAESFEPRKVMYLLNYGFNHLAEIQKRQTLQDLNTVYINEKIVSLPEEDIYKIPLSGEEKIETILAKPVHRITNQKLTECSPYHYYFQKDSFYFVIPSSQTLAVKVFKELREFNTFTGDALLVINDSSFYYFNYDVGISPKLSIKDIGEYQDVDLVTQLISSGKLTISYDDYSSRLENGKERTALYYIYDSLLIQDIDTLLLNHPAKQKQNHTSLIIAITTVLILAIILLIIRETKIK